MRRIRHSLPRSIHLALAAGISGALALSVHAEGDRATTSAVGTKGATASPTQASAEAQLKNYRALRASELIGKSVRNGQGKDIGRIEDAVVDMTTGMVRYVMLAFDPGIFDREKLFAVPAKELRMAADRDHLVYDIRRDRLERAAVERKNWQAARRDQDFVASFDKSYAIAQPGEGARAHRLSDLLRKDVHGRDGRAIGNIEELVIDVGNQRVHYAVVSFDPGIWQAEKEYVLPLDAFELGPQGNRLVLDIAQSKLHGMRAFTEDRYTNLNDGTWVRDIERYLAAMKPTQGSASASGTSAANPTGGTPTGAASRQGATSVSSSGTSSATSSSGTSGSATSGAQMRSREDRDRTQVVPDKGDLTPFKPSIEVLDDNTQRAHDRDQGVRAERTPTDGKVDAAAQTSGRPGLADEWKRMDRNGDNLISPQEMREALNLGTRPAGSASPTSAAGTAGASPEAAKR